MLVQVSTSKRRDIDTVFGPKAKENEEIRGLLNAGHRRGAVAGRCVVRGKVVETEGKLARMELTKEQAIARARHEAEEQGRQFKAGSVKGPVTIYQLQGSGALIPAD